MLSQNGNILFRKLHSMRETPQHFPLKKTTRHKNMIRFEKNSLFDTSLTPHMYQWHVKMSLTRGQYAWFSTSRGRSFLRFSLPERETETEAENAKSLQKDNEKKSAPLEHISDENIAEFQLIRNLLTELYQKESGHLWETLKNSLSVDYHQRLYVEKHSQDWLAHWLVGLTEGDGTFCFDRTKKPNGKTVYNLVFKISLDTQNTRAIAKAKKILGAGKITTTPDNVISLRIRNRQLLQTHVFPIFDRVPMLSNKHYDYMRIRLMAQLLNGDFDSMYSHEQREKLLEELYSCRFSQESIAPIWAHLLDPDSLDRFLETNLIDLKRTQIQKVMSVPWVSGFIEAEGSFYMTSKDPRTDRYCHAFGLSQKGNSLLMQALRCFFRIDAKVRSKNPASIKKTKSSTLKESSIKRDTSGLYSLDTTNWRTLQFIKKILKDQLLGIKSQDFRIWERSMKHRNDSKKLKSIQQLLRDQRLST